MKIYKPIIPLNLKQVKRTMLYVLLITTPLVFQNCVSQKKYEQALSDIASLKVQQDFESYNQAGVEFKKDGVIFKQHKEILKKSIQLDSLRNELIAQEIRLTQPRMLVEAFSAEELNGIGTIAEQEGKIFIPFDNDILFKDGSSQLNPKSERSIIAIYHMIKSLEYDTDVWVIGHTDSQKFDTESSGSNWKLSLDRSLAVVNVLIDNGLPQESITAAGKSKFAPQTSNRTKNGKALNRRTEIVLVPKISIYKTLGSIQ